MKALPSLESYKDKSFDEVVKKFDGYAKHFGVPDDQILRVPKGFTRDQLTPASDLEAYQIDLKKMPEADQAFVEAFKPEALKMGLSPFQMQSITAHLSKSLEVMDKQLADQEAAAKTQAETSLNKIWGDKAAVYKNEIPRVLENLAAKAGLVDEAKGGMKAVLGELNYDGLASNPAFMRILAVVTDMMAEPGSLPGSGRMVAPEAANDIEAELKTFFEQGHQNNKALYSSIDPNHKQAVARRAELMDKLDKLKKSN